MRSTIIPLFIALLSHTYTNAAIPQNTGKSENAASVICSGIITKSFKYKSDNGVPYEKIFVQFTYNLDANDKPTFGTLNWADNFYIASGSMKVMRSPLALLYAQLNLTNLLGDQFNGHIIVSSLIGTPVDDSSKAGSLELEEYSKSDYKNEPQATYKGDLKCIAKK